MTQDQLVGKTVDYIFDVEVEDGTVTQVAYLGVVTKIVEKKKKKIQKKHCLKLFDSVYNNDEDIDDDREPDEEDTFESAFLRISLKSQKKGWHIY